VELYFPCCKDFLRSNWNIWIDRIRHTYTWCRLYYQIRAQSYQKIPTLQQLYKVSRNFYDNRLNQFSLKGLQISKRPAFNEDLNSLLIIPNPLEPILFWSELNYKRRRMHKGRGDKDQSNLIKIWPSGPNNLLFCSDHRVNLWKYRRKYINTCQYWT